MERPDQRQFEADLASADFRSGAAKSRWGLAGDGVAPADLAWPKAILWMAAATRANAPSRFFVELDLTGYRGAAPTGTFWDPDTKKMLEKGKRPKGRDGSRFAKVFRTDWEEGRAFYHPYDRHAASGHKEWEKQQPHLIWTAAHTIVDYLEEFQSLLMSEDYLGI
jgi:hypothetical protein